MESIQLHGRTIRVREVARPAGWSCRVLVAENGEAYLEYLVSVGRYKVDVPAVHPLSRAELAAFREGALDLGVRARTLAEGGDLAALWSWGFQLGGSRYPWGTMPGELPELDLRGGEEHGLPTIHRSAFAPHPERPVTGVTLQIAAEARLFEDEPLAALRARLDADLGPGAHVDSEHGPEKTSSTWRIEGASVLLDAYPSDWGFNWGRSSGRLQVSVDRERVAQPYLSEFRAGADLPPAEHGVIPAPGLREMRMDEVGFALTRPDLRAPPSWLALGDEQVAVWRLGDTVGLATRQFSIVDPPPLQHIRWAPARGPGFASLGAGPDADLLISYPRETGLDAVAARLAGLGVPVERVEEQDWG